LPLYVHVFVVVAVMLIIGPASALLATSSGIVGRIQYVIPSLKLSGPCDYHCPLSTQKFGLVYHCPSLMLCFTGHCLSSAHSACRVSYGRMLRTDIHVSTLRCGYIRAGYSMIRYLCRHVLWCRVCEMCRFPDQDKCSDFSSLTRVQFQALGHDELCVLYRQWCQSSVS